MYNSPIIYYSPILVLENKEKIQLLNKELFLEIDKENIRLKKDPMNFWYIQLLIIWLPVVIIIACLFVISRYTITGKISLPDGIIWIVMIWLFISIPISEFNKVFLKKYHYRYLTNIHNYLMNWKDILDTIPVILDKIKKIEKIFRYNLNEKNSSEIKSLELEYITLILIDLRSDLQLRLTEQKNTLESAKSEVEKNIAWTTELNQVSELQRARLNRQIEQLEELQRVLVKV